MHKTFDFQLIPNQIFNCIIVKQKSYILCSLVVKEIQFMERLNIPCNLLMKVKKLTHFFVTILQARC